MTISRTQLDQILSEPELKKFWLGYFQESFREQLQQQLLELFEHVKSTRNLSRADLARKIGRRPEQVTRWLASPTNLESDSISDMALGMGFIPKVTFEAVRNCFGSDRTNSNSVVSQFVRQRDVQTNSAAAVSLLCTDELVTTS